MRREHNDDTPQKSRLNLIDLAGSERVKISAAVRRPRSFRASLSVEMTFEFRVAAYTTERAAAEGSDLHQHIAVITGSGVERIEAAGQARASATRLAPKARSVPQQQVNAFAAGLTWYVGAGAVVSH